MKKTGSSTGRSVKLPVRLKALFWDYEFARLSWKSDSDLIIGRVLAVGDWESIKWLRRKLGDERLRTWIEVRTGAGLSPRQLRFWELVLELPHRTVNAWLKDPRRKAWDGRRHS
jgi:hypothetical protein